MSTPSSMGFRTLSPMSHAALAGLLVTASLGRSRRAKKQAAAMERPAKCTLPPAPELVATESVSGIAIEQMYQACFCVSRQAHV